MGFSFPVVKMRVELCSYSGYKIYPGRGKRMVKADGRVFNFLSHKCERSHTLKRNPREITWTVLYRRKHKKGQQEELVKKRTRRTQKFARAVAGATLSDIMAKKKQKAKEATKKATKAPVAKQQPKGKAAKNVQKS